MAPARPNAAANPEDPRGWVVSKRYENDKGPDYAYTAGCRLFTRAWARVDGSDPPARVTTTYGYAAGSGDLVSVTYSNQQEDCAIPNLAYRYTRWGALDEVDDAAGTRKFSYRTSIDLARELEVFSTNSSPLSGQVVDLEEREHRHVYDELGRAEEIRTGTDTVTPTLDHKAVYTWDDHTGRMESASHDGTQTFSYDYVAKSMLVATISGPTLDGDPFTVTNSYEPHRDLRIRVLTEKNGADLSDFGYKYNELGQRYNIIQDGSVIGTSHSSWVAGYNANGELTRYDRHGNPTFGMTSNFTDEFDFAYDPIGNRVSMDWTRVSWTDHHWTYWGDSGGTAEGGDALNQYRRVDHQLDAGAPAEADRAHDLDGNLIDDGKFLYGWDAENRMVSVTRKIDSEPIANYSYDYMGRRIWKKTTEYADQNESERIFVYCGWNLCAEYDATPSGGLSTVSGAKRTYTWGLDLSGSLQGAGGVGGLLAMKDHTGTPVIYYPVYDANGNVASMLDSDGSIRPGTCGRLLGSTGLEEAATVRRIRSNSRPSTSTARRGCSTTATGITSRTRVGGPLEIQLGNQGG